MEKIRYRIPRQPLFVDGCDEASFIEVPLDKVTVGLIYALVGGVAHETHTQIYEQAVENHLITGKTEPTGGGIIDLETYQLVADSIHYGSADPEAVAKLVTHLKHRGYRTNACD